MRRLPVRPWLLVLLLLAMLVGLPIAFDHVRPHSPRSAPTLGEHTDEVLGSLPK